MGLGFDDLFKLVAQGVLVTLEGEIGSTSYQYQFTFDVVVETTSHSLFCPHPIGRVTK